MLGSQLKLEVFCFLMRTGDLNVTPFDEGHVSYQPPNRNFEEFKRIAKFRRHTQTHLYHPPEVINICRIRKKMGWGSFAINVSALHFNCQLHRDVVTAASNVDTYFKKLETGAVYPTDQSVTSRKIVGVPLNDIN
ncbi:unnamed protein product [Taenia asiatica]|uniref:DDE Tnp4 domain-containing protein n=1 Tax=Taenia asiatica TaxID=60517 RepID=A0A0R3WE40_TAEAS|nr:unnamed protein product [Taenia asiatica]